jgi:hypothetical protein
MNTLTPFIRHEMDNLPNESGVPSSTDSRNSPPLGKPPEFLPSQPDDPNVQLPPPVPRQAQPVCTDGTPLAAHQKNAEDFLKGNTSGIMEAFMPADAPDAPPQAAAPTQEDDEVVQRLVDWREEATY